MTRNMPYGNVFVIRKNCSSEHDDLPPSAERSCACVGTRKFLTQNWPSASNRGPWLPQNRLRCGLGNAQLVESPPRSRGQQAQTFHHKKTTDRSSRHEATWHHAVLATEGHVAQDLRMRTMMMSGSWRKCLQAPGHCYRSSWLGAAESPFGSRAVPGSCEASPMRRSGDLQVGALVHQSAGGSPKGHHG